MRSRVCLGPSVFALSFAALSAATPAHAQFGWVRRAGNGLVRAATTAGNAVASGTVNAANTVANGTVNVANTSWNGIRSTAITAGSTLGNVAVDDIGRPVSYIAVNTAVPLYRATANTVTNSPIVFNVVGNQMQIQFRRGLGTATDIGNVVIDGAGNVTGTAVSGLVDGVQYAYEQGTIVAQNLFSLRCDQILNLSFGSDFSYTSGNASAGEITADCARNVAVGFACSIPGSVYDLIGSSADIYRQVVRGMGRAPCNSIPIPPANFVCGAINSQVSMMNSVVDCLRNVRSRSFAGGQAPRLDGAVCRSIGDVAFGIVLAIATDGAGATTLVRKIARGVQQLYNLNGTVQTIEGLVQAVCPNIVHSDGTATESFSTALRSSQQPWQSDESVRLYADRGMTGFSLPLGDDIRDAAGASDMLSSISVPEGGVASVYTDAHYQGLCQTFTRSIGDVSNTNIGDNQAASARLGMYCPGSLLAQVYTDVNYGGRMAEVATDIADFGRAGFAIRSIRRSSAAPIAVYSLPNYRGTCAQLTEDSANWSGFPRGFSIKSIRLNHRCDAAAPSATISYEGLEARDRTPVAIHSDVADIRTLGINLTREYLRLTGGGWGRPMRPVFSTAPRITANNGPIALYAGANFTGECTTVPAGQSRAAPALPGPISVRVNATCDGHQQTFAPSLFVSASSLCVGANGDHAELQSCDGSAKQTWRGVGDAIVNGEGRCLAMNSEDLAFPGARARVVACDRSDPQRWILRDGRFVNHLGRCLEAPRAQIWNTGANLTLTECTNSPAEQFARRTPNASAPFVYREPPAVPLDATLECSMNVPYSGGPLCRSGIDLLSFSGLRGRAMSVDTSVFPYSGSLWLRDSGVTLPNYDRHDIGESDHTVSLWFRVEDIDVPASDPAEQERLSRIDRAAPLSILAHGILSNGSGVGYRLRKQGGTLSFEIAPQASRHLPPIRFSGLTAGRWHHFSAVFDRGARTVTVRLDGSSDGWRSTASPVPGTIPMVDWPAVRSPEGIALGTLAARLPTLEIDEVRMYARALSADELRQLSSARGNSPATAPASASADAGAAAIDASAPTP